MSVPYDPLGPGQKGRAVYQVMGQDGPISNPANIRYLAIDDPGLPNGPVCSAGPSLFQGANSVVSHGLGLLNLGVGLANIGLSVSILRRMSGLEDQLRDIQRKLVRMDQKLDLIIQQMGELRVEVGEQSLRPALENALKQASSDDSVELAPLKRLESDLVRFSAALPAPGLVPGAHPNLVLSTDVHDLVKSVYGFLSGARLHMYTVLNVAVGGKPDLVMSPADPPNAGIDVDLVMTSLAFQQHPPWKKRFWEEQGRRHKKQAKKPRMKTLQYFFTEDAGLKKLRPDSRGDEWARNVANILGPSAKTPKPSDKPDKAASEWKETRALVTDYLRSWQMTDAALLYNTLKEIRLHKNHEHWAKLTKAVEIAGTEPPESTLGQFDFEEFQRKVKRLEESTRA